MSSSGDGRPPVGPGQRPGRESGVKYPKCLRKILNFCTNFNVKCWHVNTPYGLV